MNIKDIPEGAVNIGVTGFCKTTAEPIVMIEVIHAGNMGSGIDRIDENLLRVYGITIQELRDKSFSYKETGSPDYLFRGDYHIRP